MWEFPGLRQDAKVVFGQSLDFTDLFLLEDNKITHQLITDRIMEAIASILKAEGVYVNPD
jgi:1-acyl-sn-glycerol-3-phosphate acyltransferase